MNAIASEKVSQSTVAKLYDNLLSIAFVHILAAGFLVYQLWQQTQYDHLMYWGALFSIALLSLLLSQSFFKRKANEQASLAPWEGIFSNISVCISLIFSFAYCYVLFTEQANVTAVLFIVVAHVACSSVPCFYSKKALLSSSLPIVIPVVGMLAYQTNMANLFLLVGILAFASIFTILGLSFQTSLNANLKFKQMFAEANERSERYRTKLETVTIEDELTRMYNRRFFDLMINNEARRAKRACSSLTIAVIEIDSYQAYLANYGQAKTEKMLVKIAKKLSGTISRGGEFIFRFDEHQFGLILPNNNSQKAVPFVNKMMDIVKNLDIEHASSPLPNLKTVTISAGISQVDHSRLIDIDEITEQATTALKVAKDAGGNKQQVYSRNMSASQETSQSKPQAEKIIAETKPATNSALLANPTSLEKVAAPQGSPNESLVLINESNVSTNANNSIFEDGQDGNYQPETPTTKTDVASPPSKIYQVEEESLSLLEEPKVQLTAEKNDTYQPSAGKSAPSPNLLELEELPEPSMLVSNE